MTVSIHPIEQESYRILAGRVDLTDRPVGVAAVIARIIHATADLEYASTVRLTEPDVEAGIEAIAQGAPVITDVEMVRAGITSVPTRCYLDVAPPATADVTRSAAAMRIAAAENPSGAVVAIGCAPTALFEVLRLIEQEDFRPALVIGLPVGFVGAAESKDAAHAAAVHTITNIGEKGGSAVAAAAVNALARLAAARAGRR